MKAFILFIWHINREHKKVEIPICCRLCSGICKAVLCCFDDKSELGNENTSLQHYSLAFLSHVLEAAPGAVSVLRGLQYLSVLLGPQFFFLGQSGQRGRNPLDGQAKGLQPGIGAEQPQKELGAGFPLLAVTLTPLEETGSVSIKFTIADFTDAGDLAYFEIMPAYYVKT